MATTEFTRTQTAGTSTKKLTVSMWVKRGSDLGGYPTLFSCGTGSSDGFNLAFTNNDYLILEAYDGSANPKLETNRKFVGIESNDKYFNLAKKWIEDTEFRKRTQFA